MSDVVANLTWQGEERFIARNVKGFETAFDGNGKTSASPVEILVESIGACSGVDVVLILEKMRTPASHLEVSVEADRNAGQPRYLTRARIRFDIWGQSIKPEKAERAVHLSVVRYCSVLSSIRPDMETIAEFRLHEPNADPSGEYQSVALEKVVAD